MPDSDDSSLLHTFCASRDEDAFTRLVRRYLPMVQAVALRRLGSATLAEEAAQNVFALLARKAAAVARHPQRLGAWLHRSAFLEASNLARSEARFARIPALSAETELHPALAMNRPEIFDQLDAALLALPETDRELLLRRYWKGEDFRVIASALGRSVESCQKRVERSLTKLGSRLGGSLPVVAVASALTTLKPSASAAAMPVVHRVVEGALQRAGSTAGSAGGILTGGIIAASLAAIVCGFWLGSPAAVSSSGARSRTLLPENRSPLAAASPLPPPEPAARPGLQDVLASIDAGRWGPLVAFLADATAEELRTLLEDRLAYDSYYWEPHPDADYEDYPGHLMLRRWTEMDPAGALHWSRGLQLGGRKATVLVFAEWLKFAPDAAVAAFTRLTGPEQHSIAGFLSYSDRKSLEVLLSAFPRLRWALDNSWFQRRNEEDPVLAQAVVTHALDGKLHPDLDLEKVTKAFLALARTDPQGAMEKAARLTAEPMRTAVLAIVRGTVPPPGHAFQPDASVPRSWERAALTRRMAQMQAASQREAVAAQVTSMPPGTDRDAVVASLVDRWPRAEPWRLLDMMVSLRGTVSTSASSVPVRGLPKGMSMGIVSHGGSDSSSTLYAAALDDPRRALGYIPKLAALHTERGNTGSAHSRIQIYLGRVLNAWVIKDRDGAAAWFGALPEEDRRTVLEKFQHQFVLHSKTAEFLRSLPR